MSRRWRLMLARGGGAASATIPLLIRSRLRNAEEGAPSGGDVFQREEIVRRHVAGQGGVVEIDGVLLAFGGGQPVQVVDQGGALCLVRLVFVEDDPAVAADRSAVLAGLVDHRKLALRSSHQRLCRRRR